MIFFVSVILLLLKLDRPAVLIIPIFRKHYLPYNVQYFPQIHRNKKDRIFKYCFLSENNKSNINYSLISWFLLKQIEMDKIKNSKVPALKAGTWSIIATL